MNSQWCDKVAYNSNNEAGKRVDLTLKLSLPNGDQNQFFLRQFVKPLSLTSHIANFNYIQGASNSYSYGMIMGGGLPTINHYAENAANIGSNNNGGQNMNSNFANTSEGQTIDSIFASTIANMGSKMDGGQHMNSIFASKTANSTSGGQEMKSWAQELGKSSSKILRHHHQCSSGIRTQPYQKINNGGLISYTLVDSGPVKQPTETGIPSSSRGRPYGSNVNDPNKRCSNLNCNTTNTPMWRRGPLGPKTLCNACGIKFRKEGEKLRAKEASK